jgi:hypothetical protein
LTHRTEYRPSTPRTVTSDLTSDLSEPIARILLGSIDTGDGGTDEQRAR